MPGIDRHSRLVGWLKLGLPLAALALLSTLFLVADRIDPDAALPYANVDVEALVRDPRMTAPAYAGTTRDGTALTFEAKAARPASANRMASADEVSAQMALPDGSRNDLTAASAEIDNAAGELRFSGGVKLTSSNGYEVTASDMVTRLDRTLTEAKGPVVAIGPAGRLDAAGFTLRPGEAADPTATTEGSGETSYLLVFSGGVKLVYLPNS